MGLSVAGPLTRVVTVEDASQVGQVRREAQALAAQARLDDATAGRVALVATELATNVLRHGLGGRVLLSSVQGAQGPGVEICSVDQGPGFSLAQCLPDGYSTGGSRGQGLGAIQRQSTLLEAWSDDRGAVVLARVHGAPAPTGDLAYGALRVPMRRETACGDGWHLAVDGTRMVATLIDGLGHGPQAEDAAMLGVEAAAEAAAQGLDADDVVQRMHARMSRSRGGAAAVFCHDGASGQARFAGVGNIAVSLHDGAGARQLPSQPGIVGGNVRRVAATAIDARPGSLLLMHSDGLQARWNLARYEGLAHRHPALVAAVLHRDFDRGRDDVGILAVRLGICA